MSKEAIKLALEALEGADIIDCDMQDAITALQQALAEQPAQQELVAVHQFRNRYVTDWYDGVPDHQDGHGPYEVRTLYTSPPAQQEPMDSAQISKVWWDGEKLMAKPIPFVEFYKPAQRTWVGLTDEEIKKLAAPLFMTHYWKLCNEFARAIEAKLKELNT